MATKKQIPVVAARIVEYQDELENLSNENAQWAIMNPKEAIALCVAAINNRTKTVAQAVIALFSPVISTFTVPATTEKFVAKDKFKVDTSRGAKVKISYLGDNFKEWFLNKIEDQLPGSIISARKLERNSIDGPILVELGGHAKAVTSLTEIFKMMEAQPHGEEGDLLNNGWANIFYVPDINGTLRAVDVCWYGGGWGVVAPSVESPYVWGAGVRVFSRNSLAPQAI